MGAERPDEIEARRLAAEIANEPQWVVFDAADSEDAWASYELEELSFAASWWATRNT
jgi:hypothetical protein